MFDIYKNKKVLITGHSGFKGSWLTLWLKEIGAEVFGYSLEPNTSPSMFCALNLESKVKTVFGNILDTEKLEKTFNEFQPEIVFHLAAQPLVRLSYAEPVNTYQTNVIGTLNVLEAARKFPTVKALINITTDKCYENIEQEYFYKEDDKLGGYDMYSSSKACSEILSSSYRNSFLKNEGYLLATVRAGNVIGGGDWAADRLVPDCIKAINSNETIIIRSPQSIRPWQHVLEPLSGYLTVGEKLLQGKSEHATNYNFGPHKNSTLTVEEITRTIIETYEKGSFEIRTENKMHEANLLMLDISKAERELDWHPQYSAKEAITETVDWYKSFYNNTEMYEYSKNQIIYYCKKMANHLTMSKPL